MPSLIPSWPSATLPHPSSSFSQDMAGMSLRTKMDSGLIRQRRRFTTDAQTFSVEWEMDDSEYQIFLSWFREVIHQGNDWFMVSLPVGGGLSSQKARFRDARYASAMSAGLNWRVSASLEVFGPERMPDGMVLLLIDPAFMAALPSLEASVSSLYTLTHTTFPANL